MLSVYFACDTYATEGLCRYQPIGLASSTGNATQRQLASPRQRARQLPEEPQASNCDLPAHHGHAPLNTGMSASKSCHLTLNTSLKTRYVPRGQSSRTRRLLTPDAPTESVANCCMVSIMSFTLSGT